MHHCLEGRPKDGCCHELCDNVKAEVDRRDVAKGGGQPSLEVTLADRRDTSVWYPTKVTFVRP